MNTIAREAFQSGQLVIHLQHGVGEVIDIVTEEIAGNEIKLIKLSYKHGVIKVPLNRADEVLRLMSSKDTLGEALKILKQPRKTLADSRYWHRTEQDFIERLNSGTIVSICEVVRDTARRGEEKISASQLHLFDTAVMRLVKEYAIVFAVSHEIACLELQKYCPDGVTLRLSDAQSVVARAGKRQKKEPLQLADRPYRLTKRHVIPVVRPAAKQLVRDEKPKAPKPPRAEAPTRKPAAPKQMKPEQSESLLAENKRLAAALLRCNELLRTKITELTALQKKMEERERSVAKLELERAMMLGAEEQIKTLKAERKVLRLKVTNLTKKVAALSTKESPEKQVLAEIDCVRKELFAFIKERTQMVERLQAYIRDECVRK